jgi:hypothetical protein
MSEQEKRVAPRVKVELDGTVSPNGRTRKEVRIENISESGLLIRSMIPVFSLSRVQVSLDLDGKPFESQAICVRVTTNPPWEAGLHFVEIDEESRRVLDEFIQKRLTKNEEN